MVIPIVQMGKLRLSGIRDLLAWGAAGVPLRSASFHSLCACASFRTLCAGCRCTGQLGTVNTGWREAGVVTSPGSGILSAAHQLRGPRQHRQPGEALLSQMHTGRISRTDILATV